MAEEVKKRSRKLSWKDFLPIILAFPLAVLVKVFIFTTYHVPTASMLPTIIPGDHILVEKWVFGPRLYLNNKIYRFPGWRSIRQGDILVFNVPKEDSIIPQRREVNFYNWKHSHAASHSSVIVKDSFQFMPIPGRTPFVKRVIGLPGDNIQFSNYTLQINGKTVPTNAKSNQHYKIVFRNTRDFDRYKDKLYQLGEQIQMNRADRMLTGIFRSEELEFIDSSSARTTPLFYFPDPIHIPDDFTWTRALAESRLSIKIPFKGWTTNVDHLFLSQYGQILRRFEQFTGEMSENQLWDTNGHRIDQYTFNQNYYWAMGDNRPYSVDSRAWGLIPENHIIGITRRTFWSKEPEQGFKDGFRWSRFWERME